MAGAAWSIIDPSTLDQEVLASELVLSFPSNTTTDSSQVPNMPPPQRLLIFKSHCASCHGRYARRIRVSAFTQRPGANSPKGMANPMPSPLRPPLWHSPHPFASVVEQGPPLLPGEIGASFGRFSSSFGRENASGDGGVQWCAEAQWHRLRPQCRGAGAPREGSIQGVDVEQGQTRTGSHRTTSASFRSIVNLTVQVSVVSSTT